MDVSKQTRVATGTELNVETMNWDKAYLRLVVSSLVVLLVTAFFSVGYIHFDEHFQILEFASFKLGTTESQDLPWEFEAQIRPWLQPSLAYALFAFFKSLGVTNPFALATLLRFFSALLSWAGLVALLKVIPTLVSNPKHRVPTALVLCFLYFEPIIRVRTSSENYSAAAFALGLYFLLRASRRATSDLPRDKEDFDTRLTFFSGLAFSAAFQFRYQAAFLIVAAQLWALIAARNKVTAAGAHVAGFVLVLALSGFIDRWGYGEWSFPAWNYLKVNLFQGKASSFGTNPWYDYFVFLGKELRFPFGILAFVGFLFALVRRKRHILTWCSAAFLLGHIVVAHKEFRFLFPMLNFFPIVVVPALIEIKETHFNSARLLKFIKQATWILVALNVFYVFRYTLRSQTPVLRAQEAIYSLKNEANVLLWTGQDPFVTAGGLTLEFYKPKAMTSLEGTQENIEQSLARSAALFYAERKASSEGVVLPSSCEVWWSDRTPVWLPQGWLENRIVRRLFSKKNYHEVALCRRT